MFNIKGLIKGTRNGQKIRNNTVFELRETSQGFPYNGHMQLHFLELPKYDIWKSRNLHRRDSLNNWISFFKFSEREVTDRHIVEMSKDPIMSDALKALEKLSEDPSAQELSQMREKSRINLQIITGAAFEEGREEERRNSIRLMAKKGATAKEIANLLDLEVAEVIGIIAAIR